MDQVRCIYTYKCMHVCKDQLRWSIICTLDMEKAGQVSVKAVGAIVPGTGAIVASAPPEIATVVLRAERGVSGGGEK